jgi:enoyl-CoA hydratase
MGTPLVTYRSEGRVATITMDDGKSNALSPRMIAELDAALDRAESEGATVVLTGREGVFSAGFDLRVLGSGGVDALRMLTSGFALAERVLSFPTPIVIACSGHAIAMGVFLLLSGDYRVGTAGAFKLVANEVAIGLPVPRAGVEICRQRLAPSHFQRAVVLAEPYSPDTAIAAGFLDRVVAADELAATASRIAAELATLDMRAHAITKMRVRGETVRSLRAVRKSDLATFVLEAARRFVATTERPTTRGS